MTDTLPMLRAFFKSTQLRRPRALPDFGHLLVAAIYALALVAAPVLIRYAPAPSATAIATPATPHVDCSAGVNVANCRPAPVRPPAASP